MRKFRTIIWGARKKQSLCGDGHGHQPASGGSLFAVFCFFFVGSGSEALMRRVMDTYTTSFLKS